MNEAPTDFIAEAITEWFGARCPEYAEGCASCDAWKQYDDLRAYIASQEAAAPSEELAQLREYAHAATIAITGLTGGGSEYFGKQIGDIYTADLDFSVKRIRESRDAANQRWKDAVHASKSVPSEEPVAEFGEGKLVIDTGTFRGRPAVFIAPAKMPGEVGASAAREGHDLHSLQPGEIVWAFPTDAHARAVADALVASPAVAPVAVSVKGLEWKWSPKLPDEWYNPEGYKIRRDVGNPDLYIVSGWKRGTNPHETITAAKAAAQSDFNARILSSIIPATKGGEDIDCSKWLGELLATIHRDGGQYQALHGDEKAVADAHAILAAALTKNAEPVVASGDLMDSDYARDIMQIVPATPPVAPTGTVGMLVEAMRADPFIDDFHLLGTTQQDMRMQHYAKVALAALSAPTVEGEAK